MTQVLEAQNWLWNPEKSPQEALDTLTEEFGIKVRQYDDRVVLNYCQINSPKTHPITRECRGLILSYPCFNILCRSFDRFYNLGEAPEITEQVDFSRATCYEKADGSLINVYHDGNQWQIATRGTAFAESENYTGKVFRDMVLEAFKITEEEFQHKFSSFRKDITCIFEFTSPENRIVTPYKYAEMVLLAVRYNQSGEYAKDKFCGGNHWWRSAKAFPLATPEEALQAAKELSGLQEGYVVFDPVSGERVKIKSPAYVAVHHIRGEGQLTPKRVAQLVCTGEEEEYLTYFPEDAGQIEPYTEALEKMTWEIITYKTRYADIESQKEFALLVKDKVYSSVLFQVRARKASVEEVWGNLDLNQQVKMLLKFMEK